jgi:seryl-tRNA synthetase
MLDLRLIRRDPDAVRAALARRGDDGRLDEVLDLDADWRAATASAERLRAEQKTASDAIAEAKRAGEDAGPLLERMRDMSAQVKSLTERARTAEERLQGVLATLPNLPDPTSADEDTVIR